MDLKQLTRGDRIAGISAILLVLVLFTLPWHIVDQGFTPLGEDRGDRWIAAIEAPNGFWGWVAILCAVFMIVMIVLDRLVGAEELPVSYYQLTLILAVGAGVALLIKLWRDSQDLGWGAALAVVLCIVMIYGAWLVFQAAGEGGGDSEVF